MKRSFINVLQFFFLIQLDILKQTSHVLLVAKKRVQSLRSICLLMFRRTCKELRNSLPPIFPASSECWI